MYFCHVAYLIFVIDKAESFSVLKCWAVRQVANPVSCCGVVTLNTNHDSTGG